jgi:hypothetical protein
MANIIKQAVILDTPATSSDAGKVVSPKSDATGFELIPSGKQTLISGDDFTANSEVAGQICWVGATAGTSAAYLMVNAVAAGTAPAATDYILLGAMS